MASIITKLHGVAKKCPAPLYDVIKRSYFSLTGSKLVLSPPPITGLTYSERSALMREFVKIHKNVHCAHRQEHVIAFTEALLSIPISDKGCVVEAGVFKGGSSAKFSLAAKRANRKLVLFDSFEGLPENDENHETSVLGHSIDGWFKKGLFCGQLEEVKHNISEYGHLELCEFVQGWFDDTMPSFKEDVAAAYLDVDLASSTKTCLKYLYPLLIPGGVIYSQDGDFPLVIDVFNDDDFWEKEVGCKKPEIFGLGTEKIIYVVKPKEG